MLIALLSFAVAFAAPPPSPPPAPNDPYLWLEQTNSDQAMAWVKTHNTSSLGTIQADPNYAGIEADIRKIVLAPDKLPTITVMGGSVFNFWQDDTHVRGIWRRTTVQGFQQANPPWETV